MNKERKKIMSWEEMSDPQKKLCLDIIDEVRVFQWGKCTPTVEAEIRSTVEDFNNREEVIASGIEFDFFVEENELIIEAYERY